MLVLAPPRPGELATTLASLGPHATASEGATPLVVRHTLCGHAGAVRAVCWAHDDRFLVSCAADGSVYVWDAITGQRQDSLNVSDRLNRPQPYSALALAQPSTQTTCEDAQEPQRLCCAGPDGKLTQLTWTPQPSSRGASVSSTTDFAGILLRKFLRVVHIFRSTEWSLDRSRAASRDRERERERERDVGTWIYRELERVAVVSSVFCFCSQHSRIVSTPSCGDFFEGTSFERDLSRYSLFESSSKGKRTDFPMCHSSGQVWRVDGSLETRAPLRQGRGHSSG